MNSLGCLWALVASAGVLSFGRAKATGRRGILNMMLWVA